MFLELTRRFVRQESESGVTLAREESGPYHGSVHQVLPKAATLWRRYTEDVAAMNNPEAGDVYR